MMTIRSRLRRCVRYVPSSTQVVKATCVFVIFGLLTTLMFARNMIPIIQGTIGIVMSLETYFSVNRGERWFLKWYAVYNVLNCVISYVVGGIVLSDVDIQCSTALDRVACNDTGVLYGIILTLGASSVGVFAAISSSLAYLSMSDQGPTSDDFKVDL